MAAVGSLIHLEWFATDIQAWSCLRLVWSSSAVEPPSKRLIEVEGYWTLRESLGLRRSVLATKERMNVFHLFGDIVEEFTLKLDHG